MSSFLTGSKNSRMIIRLKKKGRRYYPIYEIVVIKRKKRNRGRPISRLGYFNPHLNERGLFLDLRALGEWLNRGVSLHKSVKKHLSKFLI